MRWRDIRPGHVIVCPDSGRPERVTSSQAAKGGRRWVRCVEHDHVEPGDGTVEVVERRRG